MNARIGKIRAAVALTAATLALATGCTAPGNPIPRLPDLSALDVGEFGLEPLAEPANGNEGYGRALESVRLAEVMADPLEVDPTLKFSSGGFGATPLPTPAKAVAFLADPVRAVLQRNGMVAGFAVGATDKDSGRTPPVGSARLLTIMVLRFPDAATATRAAEEIDTVDAAVNPENVAVGIPEYPAAHGHWRPNVPTLAVTVAHESFVVSVLAGLTAPDLGALTAVARKAFAAQLPRLRDFVATPREELAAIPLDRDGMLARMVPHAPGRWPFPAVNYGSGQQDAGWDSAVQGTGVVYGPRGSLLWTPEKKAKPELIAINGLDVLFRFPNVTAARESFTAVARKDKEDPKTGVSIPSPAGVDDVSCIQDPTMTEPAVFHFICRVLYGRYVATIFGRSSKSIQQRAAAQYALLVNSERGE
ncbi:hypothetical protein ACFQZZ_15585 [Nocardia sp. GCM10030253]|uniref:DUF7373 family lipoprotein n=1 Tax=Nocardia sp. GCM10030253 TaxID=3273404 RepID=UPI00363E13BF